MNVLRYLRVSGKGQIEGDGPERQRDSCTLFCHRNNLHCAGEYFDEGVSGTIETCERPAFVTMIEHIVLCRAQAAACGPTEPGRNLVIDAVVIEKLDRLARTLRVQEAAVAQLRKHGIKLFVADMGALTDYATDSGDPSINFIRQIMGGVAEFEKINSVKRMNLARARIRAATGKCEGAKKYGELEGEQKVLAIITKAREVKTPLVEIASRLNAENFKTRFGKQWTWKHIQQVSRPR